MKKFIFIFLLTLLISPLTSCNVAQDSSTKNEIPAGIISYKNNSVSDDFYKFVLTQKKTSAIFALTEKFEDDAEYWKTEEGKIVADTLKSETAASCMSMLYYADIAAQNSLTVDASEKADIMNNYIESFGGTKESLEKELEKYGLTIKALEEFIGLQVYSDKGIEYLYGDSGVEQLTDEDYMKYFSSYYITIRHLYLNNVSKTGELTADIPLTKDEKADIDKKADEIEKKLAEGSDLSEFKDLTDDGVLKSYPGGITIPIGNELYTLSNYDENKSMNIYGLYYYLLYKNTAFIDAALTSKTGEVKRVQADDGIFFIQRLELNTDSYEQYKEMIKESGIVKSKKISDTVKSARENGDFTEDKDKISAFKIQDISVIKNQAKGETNE